MKRLLTTMFGVMCAAILWAQSPQAFKYQAVIRNNQGKILVNQLVSLQISILQDNPMGDVVYMETHQVATNDYGIANLTIGAGEVVTGVFADIPWGTNTHFVKTELDITGNRNYEFIGTSQLLSVPYALYAEQAGSANNAVDDFDKDATNELQVLSLEGNMLTLSNGNTIDLGKYLDNTDQQTLSLDNNQLTISGGNTVTIDANNRDEIQAISFSNDTLYLSDGGKVYLGAYWDNTDNQTLSVSGNSLSISGGNSVQFDTDSTNEIQAISFSNDTLYLSNGGSVYLGAYWDNTDNQTLTLSGNTLSISNGNSIQFDTDSTNEIQVISFSNDTLYLSNGGSIYLGAYWDNTDNQILSIVGNELIISGGNSVVLTNNIDLDSDPINELQILSFNEDTLFLSQGNYVVLPHNLDNDTTNELQVITKSGPDISLSLDGGSFSLEDDDPQNELQKIDFNDGILSLDKNGGTVSISNYILETCLKEINILKNTLTKYGIIEEDSLRGVDSTGCLYNGFFSVGDNKKIQFSCGSGSGSSFTEYLTNKTINLSTSVEQVGWRNLTSSEWSYIINSRKNASTLHFWAKVNNVFGLVVLPDNMTNLSGITFGVEGYNKNSISRDFWISLQTLGAVFIPSIFTDITSFSTEHYDGRGTYYGNGSTNNYTYHKLSDGAIKLGVNTSYSAIQAYQASTKVTQITHTESLGVDYSNNGYGWRLVKDVEE